MEQQKTGTPKKGYYDLELMATRKRDEHGNVIGIEVKNITHSEEDRSSITFLGHELGEALKVDAGRMLDETKFQESLAVFAVTGPTRPVVLWVGLERVFRCGRIKRGPGKGRMRTLRRYDQYKDPKQAEYIKKMLEPRPTDFSVGSIQPATVTALPDVEYSLPTVPPELLRGDTPFASELVTRHAAPRAILDGVKDESENL